MGRKKILYVVTRLINKGPTNQLFGIISNLDRQKYEPVIITLSKEDEKNSKQQIFLDLDVPIYSLNSSKYTPEFLLKRKLKKYINEIKPDVVQTQGIKPDSMISSMDLSDKHCLTLRNYAAIDYTAKFGKLLGNYMTYKTYKTINNCEYVICCSKTIKDLYSNDVDADMIVIQNGVDTKTYRPINNLESKNNLREKLNIDKNDRVFLVVGSMISRKNPITIIKAFNKINKKNYKLLFLGEGPLLEESKKIATNSNIIFLGNVNNVKDYLKCADYYISASKSEGLPNSVLEAASSNLEMILSDIQQHKEIFEGFEYKPFYFETNNYKELSKIITDSINNKQTEYIQLNNEIKLHFSNEIMSNNYQKIYYKIINNKSNV